MKTSKFTDSQIVMILKQGVGDRHWTLEETKVIERGEIEHDHQSELEHIIENDSLNLEQTPDPDADAHYRESLESLIEEKDREFENDNSLDRDEDHEMEKEQDWEMER